ncbi:MAG: PIN domain-containing protein [Planctomycetes bacterium]|nr:PIN domain-containing protein [Planctomycetota bacterium]
MSKRLLDTNVLIAHWRRRAPRPLSAGTPADARRWAAELVKLYKTSLIATPVVIEFLAGTRSSHERELARAYLDELVVVDNGDIPKSDWKMACRYAERVPRNRKPRHLGDCLLKAIAERLNCDVFSLDEAFP